LRGGSSNQVNVNMKIRIPSNQLVAYKPMFLEVMKFAWIQYLSLLLPVLWVIYQFARFVFRNQIFETSVTVDK
jgi:transmembrane protein 231